MVSKVGKKPVVIPSGVTVIVGAEMISVSGPKGEVTVSMPRGIAVVKDGVQMNVALVSQERSTLARQGLMRTLLANAIVGVTVGWSRSLELVGTGYRANVAGGDLSLAVGFSHQVVVKAPTGIGFSVDANKITISGSDKQLVGKVAAEIRQIRPPEPYKGKGIKYVEEKIRRKAGKAAKAAGATGGKQ